MLQATLLNRLLILACSAFLVAFGIECAAAAVIYDESISGDLPFNGSITPFVMQLGTNEIRGNSGGRVNTGDFDLFRIQVPQNAQITSATFSAARTSGSLVSSRWNIIREGTGSLSASFLSVPTTNSLILSTQMPLGPGIYSFLNDNWSVQPSFPPAPGFADYQFVFTLAAIPGSSQASPVLPSSQSADGVFVFTNVPSGLWVDPPLVEGFHYEMTTPGSLFTGISGFPTGFSDPFTVSANGVSLGQFIPGQTLTFPGGGVPSFDVTGITPLADAGNPTAFPLQLTFSTPTASFTMQGIEPVPEPASLLAWMGFALLGLVTGARTAVGQKVRLIKGILTGLTGTVHQLTDTSRCVLNVQGWPDGMRLIVDDEMLEPAAAKFEPVEP